MASLGLPRDEDNSDVLAGPLLPAHNVTREGGPPAADGAEDETGDAEHQQPGEQKKSLRRRAHSVSNTLESLFSRKKAEQHRHDPQPQRREQHPRLGEGRRRVMYCH